jgi:hypothetical protein
LVIGACFNVCTSEVVKEVRELSARVVVCLGCGGAEAVGGSGVDVALPLVTPDLAGVGATSMVVVDVLVNDVVSWRGTGV